MIVADVVKEKFFVEIHLLRIFSRLVKGEEGVTAVEYTLIASLIAVAAVPMSITCTTTGLASAAILR